MAGPRPVAAVVNHGGFLTAFSNAVLGAPDGVIATIKASRSSRSTTATSYPHAEIQLLQDFAAHDNHQPSTQSASGGRQWLMRASSRCRLK